MSEDIQRDAVQRDAVQRDSILVINAGSSSIKFYLYDIGPGDELTPRLGGQVEGIGTSHPRDRKSVV